MKKILLSLLATGALCSTGALNAQTVLFQDSFEDYTDFAIANVGNWTLLDVDNSPSGGFQGITFPNGTNTNKAFQVFNSTTTTPVLTPTTTSNWTARTGQKAMASFYLNSGASNNDWLISPQVQITAGAGASLSFWAKSCDATYGAEKFTVLVSTTGKDVANFTAISPVITTASDITWKEYTYNLNTYAGQQIYVAIQCTSTDQFGFAVDDFKITSTAAPTTAPSCPTLSSPANAATGVAVAPTLSWAASAGADSYDVYFGTTADPTTLVGNVTTTNYTGSTTLALNTTYYWKVVPKNTVGSATGCTVYSFTTTTTVAYCGPLVYSSGVEPITSVVFGGMTNTSPAATGGTAHEFFLDKVAEVNQEGTFPIKLQGNTDGTAFTTKFIVFVDWNQDGDFLDAGETYFDTAATTISVTASTGTDGKEAVGDIVVPANALLGNTRMRIKKNFGAATFYPNPCFSAGTLAVGANTGYGQAEDYTVNVGAKLAVTESSKNGIKSYPNPVKDIFNIEAQGKIKNVKVYDVSGKQLFTKDLSEAKSQIDFSKFGAGVYVVTTVLEDGTSTSTKVIKK